MPLNHQFCRKIDKAAQKLYNGIVMKSELEQFLKKKVVLDTRSSWVYIGVLDQVTDSTVVLSEADAHNNNETLTTQEVYVMESKVTGVKANRERTYVNLDYVVGFSLLDDVKNF